MVSVIFSALCTRVSVIFRKYSTQMSICQLLLNKFSLSFILILIIAMLVPGVF